MNKMKEIKEWQRNNPDKIKGIIFNRIPLDSNGKPLISHGDREFIRDQMMEQLPKEYIVLNTPMETTLTSTKPDTFLHRIKEKFSINSNKN